MGVERACPSRTPRASRASGGERARLRSGVLHLGGLLGWQPREVIDFAEAVAGCPWHECGCAEFRAVLEEYRAMLPLLRSKARKREAGCRGSGPKTVGGGSGAARD